MGRKPKSAACNPPDVADRLFNENRKLASFVLNRKLAGSGARLILAACGGRDGAQQDAEITLWNAARYWRPDGGANFATYACCAIYRMFADVLRKQKPVPTPTQGLDKIDCTDHDRRKKQDTKEFTEYILSLIDKSDETLLRRYHLDGKTLLELSKEDAVTRETVRMRLCQVRRRAANILEEKVGNPFRER